MRSLNPLPLALIACCLLTSCSSSPRPAPRPPVPPPPVLPPALLVSCEAPVPIEGESCDAVAVTMKQLYDQYGECAGRLLELQRATQERPSGN